jgi:hypothetical protein
MAAPAGPNVNSTGHTHLHPSPSGAEWAGEAIFLLKFFTNQIVYFFQIKNFTRLTIQPRLGCGWWVNRLFLFTLAPSRGRARPRVPGLGQTPKPQQD